MIVKIKAVTKINSVSMSNHVASCSNTGILISDPEDAIAGCLPMGMEIRGRVAYSKVSLSYCGLWRPLHCFELYATTIKNSRLRNCSDMKELNSLFCLQVLFNA